ncbi:CPBP family intramembrane glutamic endopeptidase [Oceanithermus sp.]
MSASPLAFLFALELTLALAGAVWMYLAGYPAVVRPNPWRDTLYFLAGYLALLGLERLTERLVPEAYRELDTLMRRLGRALRQAGVSPNVALALALTSALGEELWFRGALLNAFAGWLGPGAGLALQATLFAAGHPAPGRAGRLYMAWAFAAGLIFGGLYLASGSLVPGILAHFLYNAKGLEEAFGSPGPASR